MSGKFAAHAAGVDASHDELTEQLRRAAVDVTLAAVARAAPPGSAPDPPAGADGRAR